MAGDRSLSIRAYAAHRKEHGLDGGSKAAVEKALKTGRIEKNRRGKINPEVADAQWAERTDQSRKGPRPDANPDPQLPSLTVSRQREAALRVATMRMEFERSSGRLVDRDEVRKRWFGVARTVRDRLRALPGRLAGDLAPALNPDEVETMIGTAVDEILAELADGATFNGAAK